MRIFYISLFIISLMLVLFIILPVINMLLNPGDVKGALMDKEVIDSLLVSLYAASTATIIALFFGTPLGYLLARYDFRGKDFVEAIVDLPIAIPHSVVGIMILCFFYNNPITIFNNFGAYIVDNFWGIVVVMLFVSVPFMVNSARDGFLMVDEELENVSRTLGASQMRTFFDISLPLIYNNIISGSILTFARGLSEVGAILIVAYFPKTMSVLILERFNNFGLSASKPIAVIMILVSIVIFALLRLVRKRK